MSSNSISTDTFLTSSNEHPEAKTYWVGFLITLPVFMQYACCFSLQRHLSFTFGLTEGVSGDTKSTLFGIAASFVYFFNLIFRVFGHNIVFGCFAARDRVLCALVAAIISMTIFTCVTLRFEKTHEEQNIVWAFLAYSFAGVCEGSYGPNMLDVCAHLGETRLWVIMAMPFGVACISLIGYASIAVGFPFWAFYIVAGVLSLVAIILYLFTIYPASKKVDANEKKVDLKQFCVELKDIGQWFPPIGWHSAIFLVNMVCLALFNPGCTLYVYNERVSFRMFGGITLSHDWFIFLYNIGTFLGDFISRKVMDKRKNIHPIWYFLMLICGFGLNFSLIPEIAPLAAFMFSWANGGLYSQSTRYIDKCFPHEFHLTATSTWLFIGDCGSVSGSNLVQLIRSVIMGIKAKMY